MKDALIYNFSTEYTLTSEEDSVWITVNNISVHIIRTDEGVVVDLYPLSEEDCDPVAGTWATFQECLPEEEDND